VGAERAGSASDGSKGQKDGGSFAGASGSSGLPGSGSHASGPLVTAEQVEALRAVVERGITDAELARATEIERDLRHDVMAHVHCLGESCPEAKAIIHLGCTSQDVVCNADICIFHENIDIIIKKLTSTISAIAGFGDEWKSLPTLGFTHYQPAPSPPSPPSSTRSPPTSASSPTAKRSTSRSAQKQIGSSAMPYKRNPMRCERICGLTRFVMNLVGNAYDTAATQWLERTLDDSSNRRLSSPRPSSPSTARSI
jgi:adenylosuccinate lyase